MSFPGPLQYLHLLKTLTSRELTLRYRGSVLGFAWALITPIATVVLLTFVFGHVLGVRWPGAPIDAYPVYLFSGLVVNGFISESIVRAPSLVVNQPNYVHKNPFPLAILAWVMTCELLLPLAIGASIVPVLAIVFGLQLHATLLLAPFALLPLVFLGVGIGWFLAAIGVYVRDLGHTTGLIATGLLLFSPVLYPLSSTPAAVRPFYYANPTTLIIENFRAVTLHGEVPTAIALTLPLIASALFAWVAYRVFDRLRDGFPDVL
jgi:lipopolysaccharide transport system permease protein